MKKFDISKFDYEEDYIIESVCQECGQTHCEEVEMCEECGSDNLINETSHEGTICDNCKHTFDMWDNNYSDGNLSICEDCYTELKEGN